MPPSIFIIISHTFDPSSLLAITGIGCTHPFLSLRQSQRGGKRVMETRKLLLIHPPSLTPGSPSPAALLICRRNYYLEEINFRPLTHEEKESIPRGGGCTRWLMGEKSHPRGGGWAGRQDMLTVADLV